MSVPRSPTRCLGLRYAPMEGLRDAIDAHVPRGARVLTIGLDGTAAKGRRNGTTALALADAEGGLPEGPFDVVVLADVLGLADDPAAILGALGARLGEGGAVLVAEPDADVLARDPQGLAAERRRRFTRATLDAALASAGLAVTGWPVGPEGVLVARAVSGDDAAVLAELRRELDGQRALAERAAALEDERDALQARVIALEARERELRERLLDAHELLGTRDTEVARLLESDRELQGIKGTVVFRAGWRYWHLKGLGRQAAARARRGAARLMRDPARCAIVIPVHGRAALTRQCIDALLREPRATAVELVVVDDGSPDGTDELLRGYGDAIRHVRHEEAQGFAASCNDGARATDAELLCFLNNDVVPCAGWLDELVAELDAHPDAAVAGSKLLYPDGTVQHAGVVDLPRPHPAPRVPRLPGRPPGGRPLARLPGRDRRVLPVRRAEFEAARRLRRALPQRLRGHRPLPAAGRGRPRRPLLPHERALPPGVGLPRAAASTPTTRRCGTPRWRPTVRSDEFEHYLEDGLLEVRLRALLPAAAGDRARGGAVRRRQGHRAPRAAARRARTPGVGRPARQRRPHGGAERAPPRRRARPAGEPARWSSGAPPGEPEPVAAGRVQVLGAGGPLVSVCLPVKNGGARLEALLDAVLAQQVDCRLELVAVDSGSTDGSLDALVARGVRVVRIPPEGFNHGRTRNVLVSLADGDPLVFLSQRAIPDGPGWLAALLAALDDDPSLAGVSSRMLPPDGFSLLAQRDVRARPQRLAHALDALAGARRGGRP